MATSMPLTPKNWLADLLVYEIIISSSFSSYDINDPEDGNPIVESTSITVELTLRSFKIWVFGSSSNVPRIEPSKLISLWYPLSTLIW